MQYLKASLTKYHNLMSNLVKRIKKHIFDHIYFSSSLEVQTGDISWMLLLCMPEPSTYLLVGVLHNYLLIIASLTELITVNSLGMTLEPGGQLLTA